MKTLRHFAPFGLLLYCLILLFYQIYRSAILWRDTTPSEEMVIKWESNIQTLRQSLPPYATHVGYLDNSIILDNPAIFEVEEFLLTQYSVSPVIVNRGIAHQWIIGNFDKDSNFEAWLNENVPDYEIQSFGFGLYLIKNLKMNTP